MKRQRPSTRHDQEGRRDRRPPRAGIHRPDDDNGPPEPVIGEARAEFTEVETSCS